MIQSKRRIYTEQKFDHRNGLDGISPEQIKEHLALYAGYVQQVNTLDEELAELRARGRATAHGVTTAWGASRQPHKRAGLFFSSWTALTHRAFAIDVLACAHCGPAAPDRHAARSGRNPEDPRARGDGPVRADPGPSESGAAAP